MPPPAHSSAADWLAVTPTGAGRRTSASTKFSAGAPGRPGSGGGGWLPQAKAEVAAVLLRDRMNLLLLLLPLAVASHALGWPAGATFVLSLLPLCSLAERLGMVTEQLAAYTNDTLGGLLNATFGNATEVIIAAFAIRRGYLRVVKLTLLGSVISNLLLVMGSAFVAGGLRHASQRFNREGINANVGLLVLAAVAVALPTLLSSTAEAVRDARAELALSRFESVLMLACYALFLVFQLVTHRHLYEQQPPEEGEGQGGGAAAGGRGGGGGNGARAGGPGGGAGGGGSNGQQQLQQPPRGRAPASGGGGRRASQGGAAGTSCLDDDEDAEGGGGVEQQQQRGGGGGGGGAANGRLLPPADVELAVVGAGGGGGGRHHHDGDRVRLVPAGAADSSSSSSAAAAAVVVVEEDDGGGDGDSDDEEPELSWLGCFVWLALVTALVSVLSDYVMDAITDASRQLRVPLPFLTCIVVPIVGNAAEHASALIFAAKNRMELALGVAVGSSTQVGVLVVPFCVLLAWALGQPLDLNFNEFEALCYFVSVLLAAVVVQDGASNWLKGAVLILTYVFIAAGFWVHKDRELTQPIDDAGGGGGGGGGP